MVSRAEIAQALIVTAEVMGQTLSREAIRAMATELSAYPPEWVAPALRRCQRELNRLSLKAILERLDDGHPGPEEAWAICPNTEADTVVWTEQIAEAYAVAAPLIGIDDVAARMAFREAYDRILRRAREQRLEARWHPSLGHDASGRTAALESAVAKGRLTRGYADKLALPDPDRSELPVPLPAGTRSAKDAVAAIEKDIRASQ